MFYYVGEKYGIQYGKFLNHTRIAVPNRIAPFTNIHFLKLFRKMKTIQSLFFALLTTVCLWGWNAQAQTTRDAAYENAMKSTLSQLDSAQTVARVQQCKNQFERIAQKYSAEWLPLYYAAYCGINSVYYNPKSPQNETLLAEALQRIEALHGFPQADPSETHTLEAYAYTAMVVLNPQVNGQKYTGDIIRLYEQAMAENPENPRPVVCLANFESYLPDFLKSDKRNPDEEYAKARFLFEKEQPNIENPYWGKYFLEIRKDKQSEKN